MIIKYSNNKEEFIPLYGINEYLWRRIMITIIVPVYKVEKYISECVESILKQTYRN